MSEQPLENPPTLRDSAESNSRIPFNMTTSVQIPTFIEDNNQPNTFFENNNELQGPSTLTRQKRKFPSNIQVKTNMKVSDNASFQSNYEEFVAKAPQPPVLSSLPAQTNNSIINNNSSMIFNQQQSSLRRIASRQQSNDILLRDLIGHQQILTTIEQESPDRTKNDSSNNIIKSEQQLTWGNGSTTKINSKLQDSVFKTEGKKCKLIFAEDDEYFFFVKGSIIQESKQVEEAILKTSNPQLPLKSILKSQLQDFLKPKQRERSHIKKKGFGGTIDIPKINEKGAFDTQISPNTEDNSNLTDKKTEASDTEKYFNGISEALLNAPLIKQGVRGRSSILIPADASKANQNQKRSSLGGLSKEQLEKFEKRDYFRRSSDIKKLVEFQKQRRESIYEFCNFLYNEILQIINKILTLRVVQATRPSSYSCISNSTHNFYLLYLNINFIGLLLFLYPIISRIINQSSFYEGVFGDLQNDNYYAGHCFIALFILSVFRVSNQITDFSLAKTEKQSFKLIFTELKWNICAPQGRVMVKKCKIIDQILESIDDNDSDKLFYQMLSMLICQIILSLLNLVALFFILCDDKLLSSIQDELGHSFPFLSYLIVAAIISFLLLFNNLSVHFFFSQFEKVAFTFYDKAEIYLLYFNQMFILAIYQIKILGYISSDFQIHFISYNMNNEAHLCFPNYALAITEIGFYIFESMITYIVSRSAQKRIVPQIHHSKISSQIVENKMIFNRNEDNNTLQKSVMVTNINDFNKYPLKNENNLMIQSVLVNEANKQDPTLNVQANNLSQILPLQSKKSFKDNEDLLFLNNQNEQDNINNTGNNSNNRSNNINNNISKTAIRHMKKCIFIFSLNFLFLNQAQLSPACFVLGMVSNGLFSLHFSFEQKIVKRYISFLDFNQFNSQTSLISLMSLLLSAFFNCVVGFQLEPKINNLSKLSLFQQEFEYIYNQTTINQIISVLCLPYLIFSIILFLGILLIQSSRQHQKVYTSLNEIYYDLRQSIFTSKKVENEKI